MLTTFNKIYSFIIGSSVIGFVLLFTTLVCLIPYLFIENYLWFIPFFIAGVTTSVVLGSYINVILTIPLSLARKFDYIKNKTALYEYTNVTDFQEEICDFMISFFKFSGADISGCKFHLNSGKSVIKNCDPRVNQLTKEDFKNHKIRIGKEHTAYYLPIELSDLDLGYMIIVTEGFTLPMFYSILEDFEEHYLDDQILIIQSQH